MKKTSVFALTMLSTFSLMQCTSDAQALEPNITAEQRWNNYEARRLKKNNIIEKVSEYFYEWGEAFKYAFLLDILFFKNNKVETEFCEDILKQFELDLSQVTVLDKPMHGSPACTIFNTIIIDHARMSKYTKEEQAFVLGHELCHLKNKDWLTRLALSIFLNSGCVYLLKKILTSPDSSVLTPWLIINLYIISPIIMTLSRYQEKRCDIQSAKTLGLAKAGASFFEKLRKKIISRQEAPLNPNGLWYMLGTFFGLDVSHPELHERVAYLNALAQEQTA